MRRRSIPTVYEGIRFRSRLEADWAKFFDQHRMRWAYEPEGFDLDGVWYVPDFWLPDIRTIVEVKGVLDDLDREKLHRLASAAAPRDIMVILAEAPAGKAYRLVEPSPQRRHSDMGYTERFDLSTEVALVRCQSCKNWYFVDTLQGWACTACGYYDGNATYDLVHPGNPAEWWEDKCPDCGMGPMRPAQWWRW